MMKPIKKGAALSYLNIVLKNLVNIFLYTVIDPSCRTK